MKTILHVAVAAALTALPTTGGAQELIVGVGQTQFFEDSSSDSALVSLEYRHSPFYERGKIDVAWGGVTVAHLSGDVFLGGGLSAPYGFNPSWFMELSVMPGVFRENEDENDLGSAFEIRSLLALGYMLKSGNRISLAISHKSNASTASDNPGVNTVSAKLHYAF